MSFFFTNITIRRFRVFLKAERRVFDYSKAAKIPCFYQCRFLCIFL